MLPIKKAIFPVGGLGTRFLPATKSLPKEMLPVVDKPLIQYAVEEACAAGIEKLIFVTGRNKTAIEDHFDHSTELESVLMAKDKPEALQTVRDMMRTPGSVAYVRQQEPAGLGHAVWCARHLIAPDEAVAVLLADDLILGAPALSEMLTHYQGGNMVALMDVPPDEVSAYGIITPGAPPDNIEGAARLCSIASIVEKPSIKSAPSTQAVIGRYILDHSIFAALAEHKRGAGGEIQLTDALKACIGTVPFHGLNISGQRFDCGSKLGFLKANIAFALARPDMRAPLKDWIKAHA